MIPAFAWTPVPVTCSQMVGSPASTWGVYHPSTRSIEIRQLLCDALASPEASETKALAVLTVGHELAHSAGVASEAGADCIGWLIYPQVAVRIGIPRKQIAELMDVVDVIGPQACEEASHA